MKKVLITTNHPAPYINDWAEILEDEGLIVNLVFKNRHAKYKKWQGFESKPGLYYDELTLVKFIKLLCSYDLVIIGGWDNLYCLVAILLTPFMSAKIAVFSDHPYPIINKNIYYWIRRLIILRLVDYVFCATESTRLFYNKNYGISLKKLVFFPYSYNDKYMEKNILINQERETQLKYSDDPIRIYIANNFYSRKGYDILVNALKEIKSFGKISLYKFKISGTGELFENIKKEILEIDDSVEFLGWIESDDYNRFMEECDIFIHASRFEPFGIPPLDAMSKGKLLITSDGVESVSSIIENGRNGYIYSSNNSNELSNVLCNINRDRIYEIGENGRKALHTYYNKKVFSAAINQIL